MWETMKTLQCQRDESTNLPVDAVPLMFCKPFMVVENFLGNEPLL